MAQVDKSNKPAKGSQGVSYLLAQQTCLRANLLVTWLLAFLLSCLIGFLSSCLFDGHKKSACSGGYFVKGTLAGCSQRASDKLQISQDQLHWM